jgi:hypothetical protein
MPSKQALSEFEGRDVMRSTVAITNAGDGLSESMKIEPAEFHHGEKVYVVLECEVTKVRHDPFDKDDPNGPLARVHFFRAGTATVIDPSLVKKMIDEQAEKIRKAKEEEQGIQALDFDGDASGGVTPPANGKGPDKYDPKDETAVANAGENKPTKAAPAKKAAKKAPAKAAAKKPAGGSVSSMADKKAEKAKAGADANA